MEVIHHLEPETGAAPVTPLTFLMGSPEKLPTLHPQGVTVGEADAPVVPHILARARL